MTEYPTPAENPAGAPLPRLAAQLDLDGGLHGLAPVTERLPLFDHVEQLPGQTRLELPDTGA